MGPAPVSFSEQAIAAFSRRTNILRPAARAGSVDNFPPDCT
jgi:hypothetical protein